MPSVTDGEPLDALGTRPDALGELAPGAAYIELTLTHVRQLRKTDDGARVRESVPVSAITSIRIVVDAVSYSVAIILGILAGAILVIGLPLIVVGLLATPTIEPMAMAGAAVTALGVLCGGVAAYAFKAAKNQQTVRLELATPTLTLTWPSTGRESVSRLEEFAHSVEGVHARLGGVAGSEHRRHERGGGTSGGWREGDITAP